VYHLLESVESGGRIPWMLEWLRLLKEGQGEMAWDRGALLWFIGLDWEEQEEAVGIKRRGGAFSLLVP